MEIETTSLSDKVNNKLEKLKEFIDSGIEDMFSIKNIIKTSSLPGKNVITYDALKQALIGESFLPVTNTIMSFKKDNVADFVLRPSSFTIPDVGSNRFAYFVIVLHQNEYRVVQILNKIETKSVEARLISTKYLDDIKKGDFKQIYLIKN